MLIEYIFCQQIQQIKIRQKQLLIFALQKKRSNFVGLLSLIVQRMITNDYNVTKQGIRL